MFAFPEKPSPAPRRRTRTSSLTTGFSLVELLVVISIIVVLMGILLVAMGPVQDIAKKMTTTATMRAFANAAEQFQMEHGQYPGVIPDAVLAADPKISTTENALLHLMGGYRVLHPIYAPDTSGDYASFTGASITEITFGSSGWSLKFDPITFGEGPIIKGKPHAPYMTPDDKSLAKILGAQIGEPSSSTSTDGLLHIPDLIDGWGQPIIYLRQQQKTGILCGSVSDRPQFVISSAPGGPGLLDPYLKSTQLGELGEDQTDSNPLGKHSILNALAGGGQSFEDRLAMICQSPALYDTNDLQAGTARGSFALFSPGPDGIYFSRMDGPGSPAQAQDDIANPDLVKEYDDVILFGGG